MNVRVTHKTVMPRMVRAHNFLLSSFTKAGLQSDSSPGHDQPSDPVLTILYAFARLAVSLGLSGVCMDPVMWLMTAVVCVCRLGEGYVCACVWVFWGRWARGICFRL